MSNIGIYKISIGPHSFYYGSSIRLSVRKAQHMRYLKKGTHHNKRMQRAWNKYQDFKFEIVEYCTVDDLIVREQYYLDKYYTHKYNMNLANKAQGGLGPAMPESAKASISRKLTGRKLSEETKQKLRKKKSPEALKNMKAAQQDRPVEVRERISKTLKGHPVSEETRQKIRQKCRKLTDTQIREIKKLKKQKHTNARLAEMYSVSTGTISMIVNNKLWAEVS